jgi:hypothetical protein
LPILLKEEISKKIYGQREPELKLKNKIQDSGIGIIGIPFDLNPS